MSVSPKTESSPAPASELTSLRKAVFALREMRAQLDAAKQAQHEPIAIIGMACRFPGSGEGVESFWEDLRNGRDSIVEIPADRWDVNEHHSPDLDAPGKMYTRHGGFLRDIDKFDASFFGITPREAERMDPQQRIALEVGWEALENAGVAADSLARTKTGVFMGLMTADYLRLIIGNGNLAAMDPFAAMGNDLSFVAGRFSYVLGLQGPSMVVTTACSSSLVSLHLACQSLRNQECSLALAGGVNAILTPEMNVLLSKTRVLAPDGRCKTFDAAGDGYSRGEGCGVLVLKRLSDALKSNDHILAVVRGSAVNHNGPSGGLTVPNGLAQEALIREALQSANVKPADIDYVETHGTGTPLGDPIELRALGNVLQQAHSAGTPCLIGSVKTNIGHLEAAAGVAGVIKVVLALRHKQIPPHLHFKTPNPHIPWDELPLKVVDQLQSWPRNSRPRLAGVSSFGLTGINAHVVIEEAPEVTAEPSAPQSVHLLALSAKTPASLKELARRFHHYLEANPRANIADVCYSANNGRSRFEHRLALITKSVDEATRQLQSFTQATAAEGLLTGDASTVAPKIVFLFSGQGSQRLGMGHDLYASQPVFRAAMDQCNELSLELLERPLLSVIYSRDSDSSLLQQTANAQPALFALQYALSSLWLSWGIRPAAVLGHSVGELAAATVAGVFGVEDGFRLAVKRGQTMQDVKEPGEMFAVHADEMAVAKALRGWSNEVSIAAINAPRQTVISGRRESVRQVAAALAADGFPSQPLVVSHAFHSPLMEEAVRNFQPAVEGIEYSSPRTTMVSGVTGAVMTSEVAESGYWSRQIREPVRFLTGLQTLAARGLKIFVEIGPGSTLVGLARQCVEQEKVNSFTWLSSLSYVDSSLAPTYGSLAELYVRGAPVVWEGFERTAGRRKVPLPSTPFKRKRHWVAMPGHKTFHTEPAEVAQTTFSPEVVERTRRSLYQLSWIKKGRLGLTRGAGSLLGPTELSDAMSSKLPVLKERLFGGLSDYVELIPRLEELSAAYAAKGLQELGWRFVQGEITSVDSLAQRLGIIRPYRRLLGRMLEMLEAAGILRRCEEDGWQVLGAPAMIDTDGISAELSSRFAGCRSEIELLRRCGGSLGRVLQGQLDPLELLFSKEERYTLDKFYQESPAYDALNVLIKETVATALSELPKDTGLRVLEVGAGTGATTANLLPLFPADRTEYVFTDISPAFTVSAQERFRDYPFVDYQVFDAERSPRGQGLAEHRYDLVIAVNVLHATSDLRRNTGHLVQLLAPGGTLVLVEGIRPQGWLDIIFGMLPGWWNYTDLDLRPSHPLLPAKQWKSLLTGLGFTDVQAIPGESASVEIDIQQSIIVARAGLQPSPKLVKERNSAQADWIVFTKDGDVGAEVIAQLKARAENVVVVNPGDRFAETADAVFSVNPESPDDFTQLFQFTIDKEAPSCKGVLYLWGLDCTPSETLVEVEETQRLSCGGLLQVVRGLRRVAQQPLPALWVITSKAVRNDEEPGPFSAEQATLWGLGRVVALEHPELWGGLIDVDDSVSAETCVAGLLEELELDTHENRRQGESQLVHRSGERYAARFTYAADNDTGSLPLTLRNEATYVVTGAFGGLGLTVAKWLVERGAKSLALIGRRSSGAATQAALSEFERQGVTVRALAADVADEQQMSEAFAAISKNLPPIRGVFHAAGVLKIATLEEVKWDDFASVLAPKVKGVLLLHRLTKEMPLDFFVLFSSAASLVGEPGTASYSAANSFLDAFAQKLRADNVPAVSINWGEWSGIGMAREVAARRESRRTVIEPPRLSVQEGLCALEMTLRNDYAQVCVMPYDWEAFRHRLLLPERIAPLFELVGEGIVDGLGDQDGFAQKLLNAPPEDRELLMREHVRSVIGRTLGITIADVPAEAKILDLGLDSLMVMELLNYLKQSLKLTLYPREIFERSDIPSLARYITVEFERANGLRESPASLPDDVARLESQIQEVRPAPTILERNPPMVFILSAPRSGSTLLRVMLAGHPALFSPPELHLLPFDRMVERREKLNLTYFGEGLQRALMELNGATSDVCKQMLSDWEAQDAPVQEIYRKVQEQAAPRLLVDKTPAYAASLATLQRAEALFEDARYICLVRHPYAVIESFVRLRFNKLVGADEIDPHRLAEEVWSRSYQNIKEFSRLIDPRRVKLIKYEELVLNPAAVMQSVCEFLGIEFSTSLLQPYEGARMLDGVNPASLPLNDPNFLNHTSIDPALADAWKNIELPIALSAQTRRLATELGYEMPDRKVEKCAAPVNRIEEIVSVRGLPICLCSWGDKSAPLVFLVHGLLEHGAAWEQVAVHLVKKGFRVVAPDLRGHGRSGHAQAGGSYNLIDFLADIDFVVRAEAPEPFILVGHSMGAALSALFGGVRFEKIRSLVLIEPPVDVSNGAEDQENLLTRSLDYLASPQEHPAFASVEVAAQRLQQIVPSMPNDFACEMAERITEPCAGGVRWTWDPLLRARLGLGFSRFGAEGASLLQKLAHFKSMVTLVFGDTSNLMRPEHAELQRQALPDARRVVLHGAHNLHYDAAEALAEVIVDAAASAENHHDGFLNPNGNEEFRGHPSGNGARGVGR